MVTGMLGDAGPLTAALPRAQRLCMVSCGRFRSYFEPITDGSARSGRARRRTKQMDHPTTRVLAVLELLQSFRSLRGAELAARLEIDHRTVRRYITLLQDLGIPV